MGPMMRVFDEAASATAPCDFCLRIRLFITMAAALIGGMYLQPVWAVALAGLLPSAMTLAFLICAVGSALFAFRFLAHRRLSGAVDPAKPDLELS